MATVVQPSQITVGRDTAGGYTITLPVPTLQNGVLANFMRKVDFAANTKTEDIPQYVARQAASSMAQGGDNKLYLFGTGQHHSQGYMLVCNTPSAVDCTGDNWGFSAFAFGSLTPLAEIPASGSASYAGIFGTTLDWFNTATISGRISLLLDFATRAATGSMTDVENHFDDALTNGRTDRLADFVLNGQIDSNGFLAGTASQPDGTGAYFGNWSAGMFGPGGSEVAGVLRLQQAPDAEQVYIGTFGAARQ